MVPLEVEAHPLLELRALVADFSAAPEGLASPAWLRALLRPDASAELPPPDTFSPDTLSLDTLSPDTLSPDSVVRGAVRELLRYGGYKPTGRGKPASEYLARAAADGTLSSINAAVDAGNAVSLHSGLPVSVVDLARARAPFRVGVAPAGASYVFNASGQSIDLAGLLCLFDAEGPCANAVKDAQRTKTTADTRRVLCVVWGTRALPGRTERTVQLYRDVLTRLGAEVTPVA